MKVLTTAPCDQRTQGFKGTAKANAGFGAAWPRAMAAWAPHQATGTHGGKTATTRRHEGPKGPSAKRQQQRQSTIDYRGQGLSAKSHGACTLSAPLSRVRPSVRRSFRGVRIARSLSRVTVRIVRSEFMTRPMRCTVLLLCAFGGRCATERAFDRRSPDV